MPLFFQFCFLLLQACTAEKQPEKLSAEPVRGEMPSCVTPALISHKGTTIAAHRTAASEPPDVVLGGWKLPKAKQAVVSAALAKRLQLSIGGQVKSIHQLPNGAAERNMYQTAAIVEMKKGHELSLFVSAQPCSFEALPALPSADCSVLINSPKGAAVASILAAPLSISVQSGQVAVSSGLAKLRSFQSQEPILLTTQTFNNRLFTITKIIPADKSSAVYVSSALQHELCSPK